jgi:hypothetical protein
VSSSRYTWDIWSLGFFLRSISKEAAVLALTLFSSRICIKNKEFREVLGVKMTIE